MTKYKILLILGLLSLVACREREDQETVYETVIAWETSRIVRAPGASDSHFTNYYYISGGSKHLIRGLNILQNQAPADFNPVTSPLDYAIDRNLLIKVLNRNKVKEVEKILDVICSISSSVGDSSGFKVLTEQSDLRELLAEHNSQSALLPDSSTTALPVVRPDDVEFRGDNGYCWLRQQGLYRVEIMSSKNGRLEDIQVPFVGFLGIETNFAVKTSTL